MPGDNNNTNNLTDAQRKEAAEAAAALAIPSGDLKDKRNSTLDDENFVHMNKFSEIRGYGGITTSSNLGNAVISDFGLSFRPEGINTEFGLKASYSLSPKTLTTDSLGPEAPEFSSSFYGVGASMNFLNNNLALQSYAGFGKTQNAVFLDNGSIYSAEKTSPAIQFGASTGPNLAKFVNLGFSYTTYLSGAAKVQPTTQEVGVYNQSNYLELYVSAGYNDITISHNKKDETDRDTIGVNVFAKLGSYLGGEIRVADQQFTPDVKFIPSIGIKLTTNSLTKG